MTLFKRSIIFGLSILWSAVSQNETVTLSFDELTEYSMEQSLSIQMIKEEFELVKTEMDIDLQWTNPTFNYSQEFVNEEFEYYFTLNKQIEFPWIVAQRRKSWNAYIKAADYKMNEQIREFNSELKNGYCEIKLLEIQLSHLEKFKDAIVNLSDVANSQFQEGNISGIEQHLIQMSLINITVNMQNIERKLESVKSQWKIKMGMNVSAELKLSSRIIFQPIVLETVDQYLSMSSNSPGYLKRKMMKDAIQNRIKLEKKQFIPHFSVFGGPKQIDGNQGYITGISIPIPVLNRNKAGIQKQKIDYQLAVNKLERFDQYHKSKVKSLVIAIHNLADWHQNLPENLNNDSTTISSLISAYEEGWMSLTEMLNAIQIHSNGKQQYYEQLILYYKNIFQLEAITGESLVAFAPKGENK